MNFGGFYQPRRAVSARLHCAASTGPTIAAANERSASSHMLARTSGARQGAGFNSEIMSASLEDVKLLQNSDWASLSIPNICNSTRVSVLSGGSRRRLSAAWRLRALLSIPTQHLQGRQPGDCLT